MSTNRQKRANSIRTGSNSDPRNAAACHQDVRTVAVAMAHEAYAALMQKNEWYRALRDANPGVSSEWLEKGWVNEHWPTFINGARATMAAMLAGPSPEPLKEQITEALILDKTLMRQRESGARIMQNKGIIS